MNVSVTQDGQARTVIAVSVYTHIATKCIWLNLNGVFDGIGAIYKRV